MPPLSPRLRYGFFSQEVFCRAAAVYRWVNGHNPSRQGVRGFLQIYPIPMEWDRYPAQKAELEEKIGPNSQLAASVVEYNQEMVEREKHIGPGSAYAAAVEEYKQQYAVWKSRCSAAAEQLQVAKEDLLRLEEALIQKFWNEGWVFKVGGYRFTPTYDSGELFFSCDSSFFSSGFEVEKPEKPPFGSPAFLQDLREKAAGKALRLHLAGVARDRDGNKASIRLGEGGRGRELVEIPVIGVPEEGAVQVTAVRLGFANGRLALRNATGEEVSSDFVLMGLDFIGGWRGWVKYELPEEAVVLATGECAQGAAGWAGGWSEHLALLPVGVELKYTTGGGGGHIGGPHWVTVLDPDAVRYENETQHNERLAREAAEKGAIEWL